MFLEIEFHNQSLRCGFVLGTVVEGSNTFICYLIV